MNERGKAVRVTDNDHGKSRSSTTRTQPTSHMEIERLARSGDSPTDAELVADAQAGDGDAFAELFHRHYDMIYSMAFRMMGAREDAEDIAQECFVRVARSIASFRGRSKFTTWLYRVAINTAKDWYTKERRRKSKLAELALHKETEQAGAPDPSEAVLAALDALPLPQREAIVLTIYQGLSHAEAARVSGCAAPTISWRVMMAKRALRKLLDQGGER